MRRQISYLTLVAPEYWKTLEYSEALALLNVIDYCELTPLLY